jgi:hypothetical protein
MREPNAPVDKDRLPSTFAVDECPFCHTPVSPGKPVGHWDGRGTAGFLYAAKCEGCGTDLVGTGRTGAESPEVVIWTKAG